MKGFLRFAVRISLIWAAALVDAEAGLKPPRPRHSSPLGLRLDDPSNRREAHPRPVNIDLSVWRVGRTDLQWSGNITVGNPPQTFNVIFDTDAPLLLIPRNNCTTCGDHALFDPSKSSTFANRPGTPLRAYFGSAGGGTIPYVEPQGANCTIVSDTVRMGDRSATQQQFLLCDTFSEGLRVEPADGIFGLPSTPTARWNGNGSEYKTAYWQLVNSGQLPSPEFSFSYVPNRRRSGVLTLGGTDPSQYVPGTLKKMLLDWPLSESRWRWVVDVHSARIGGDDGYQLHNSTDAVTLVDTGAAAMVTPDNETTRELYGRMSDQIRPIDNRGSWGAPCDVLDRAAADVTFTVGSGTQTVDVVLRKRYVNVGEYPGLPGICQGVFINPQRTAREPIRGRPAWIFGTPWLRSYYTVWNGVDRTLGFATPVGGERE